MPLLAPLVSYHVVAMPKTYRPPFDLPDHFPFLKYKTTVRLHPRQQKVEDSCASKIRGHIAWPVNEQVPRCPEDDSPMIAVLQLRKEDVPEMKFPEGKNLFQMLWCPRDGSHEDHNFGPTASFHWRDSEALVDIRDKLPNPVDPEEELCPKECALSPERVDKDLPSGFDLGVMETSDLDLVDQWIIENAKEELDRINVDGEECYHFYFSSVPGTKVGGHPEYFNESGAPSCDQCKKKTEYLLTIASREDRQLEPFRDGDWNAARQEAWDKRPELCIVDNNNFHVFICRHCEG